MRGNKSAMIVLTEMLAFPQPPPLMRGRSASRLEPVCVRQALDQKISRVNAELAKSGDEIKRELATTHGENPVIFDRAIVDLRLASELPEFVFLVCRTPLKAKNHLAGRFY